MKTHTVTQRYCFAADKNGKMTKGMQGASGGRGSLPMERNFNKIDHIIVNPKFSLTGFAAVPEFSTDHIMVSFAERSFLAKKRKSS
ncbi:hypothetical protein KIN20_018230 [Parelaphostrongylus tenuis]|uniref:Uncharacterized protein n=1 Tax=Parelaphostrongylus tenuis TaxID=148309 RepID=A0AAD5MJ49_PARTN|nr:hypothetical protein KIN20_018230 [Parelaphostrongylus tenuis]